jgi:hypothetical protein
MNATQATSDANAIPWSQDITKVMRNIHNLVTFDRKCPAWQTNTTMSCLTTKFADSPDIEAASRELFVVAERIGTPASVRAILQDKIARTRALPKSDTSQYKLFVSSSAN